MVHESDRHATQSLLVRSIIDQAPTARARLWDYIYAQHEELSHLIAGRLKTKADDLRVVLTARLVMTIVGLALDRWRASGGKRASRKTAEELMLLLETGEVVFPRPKKQTAHRPRGAKS